MDVIHSAIWVSDIEATLEFYVEELGLEKTNDFVGGDDARNVYVRGESDTEIQFKHNPDHDLGEPATQRFDHLALEVDDTDALVERLTEETESELVRGPLDSTGVSGRIAFVTDPDGYVLELIEPRDDL